ncbi:MAG: hypothetical protein QNK04_16235 [Myxococcota bacterium]|nr:hypothetical protein [Myxococcota bacterium]
MSAAAGAPPRPGHEGRPRSALVFLAAASLVLYAPLLSWLQEDLLAAFRYFAADAFYYMTVAERSAEAGFYTFDGSHPTNGFQPLFQAWLRLGYGVVGSDPRAQILFGFVSSALFTALGTGFFALAVLRATGSPSLALLAAVPGFYAWLVPSATPELDTRWSFVNGMESSCSILFFGVLLWLLLSRDGLRAPLSAGRLVALSMLLTGIAFARLDEGLLFVPFAVWVVLGTDEARERWRRAVWLLALPGVAFGAYLLHNFVSVGAALPLSGVAKLGPLAFFRNGYAVLTTLFPAADLRGFDLATWRSEAWRVAHMLVPAVAAAAWLAWRRPRSWWPESGPERARVMVALLAIYVLLRAAFNFAFVDLWNQGSWYFPLSMLGFDLMVALALADLRDGLGWGGRRVRWAPLATTAVLAVAATSHAGRMAASDRHRRAFTLYEARASLRAELEARCPGCGLLSFDDGVLAWTLGLPTLNGLGLVLDREAYDARRQGRLLSLAHARGHRLLATAHYPFAPDVEKADLDRVLAAYPYLAGEDVGAWRFALAHVDPASGAVFLRFEPRASSATRASQVPLAVEDRSP